MAARKSLQTATSFLLALIFCLLSLGLFATQATAKTSVLSTFLGKISPAELVPGADAWGQMQDDPAVATVLKGGKPLGHVFMTSDFVSTIGYSGKPIHVMVAIDDDAKIIGAKLVEHHEPIVLVGIPNSKMVALTESYVGADMAQEAASRGSAHDLDIVSGATVTVMIIDDSILRASVKVARALGLGGLTDEAGNAPKFELNPDVTIAKDWMTLLGDGTIRRLSLDVGQVNAAFENIGDPRAAKRPEKGAPEDRFIDMYAALVSVPQIGQTLLGDNEYGNQAKFLNEGDHAIAVAGRGRYSFKGSGYVRGGIFDRIVLVQGDTTVRFHDRDHRRIGALATEDTPEFTELDLFRIPADSGFDPTKPWTLQLLVQRAVGPVEKVFTTFEMGYRLPDQFLREIPTAPVAQATTPSAAENEQDARAGLWKRIWEGKKLEIAVLLGLIGVLTVMFFFQFWATRNEKRFFWFRMSFLTLVLLVLGWGLNAQLSVVNLMALFASLREGFTWEAFLMDPLIFILWCSVAAALIFWGRGAFCGWLCPFGALQELSNRIARALHVPQIKVPWALHERLWALKYIIFLALFGLSVISLSLAEHYAEVEPFKTSIILKFARPWPFVLFAVILLVIGLFVERFYCRYLCPLGGALAIPARMRLFDWLKRYKECGSPCHTCGIECPVQAIHPTGEINPNECINCLHCQVLYQSKAKCPVVIKKLKRREKDRAAMEAAKDKMEQVLGDTHGKKEIPHV